MMKKRNGIVVLGASFVDIKGYPIAQYIPGGRNAGRVVQVHGGVARNVVEDIANVELEPTFVSLVDQTGTGADVIEKLNRHRVNTEYMRRTEDGLGTWLALFDNNGDVVGSISKRPDLSEIGNILDEKGDEIFEGADSVIVEIDMDPAIMKKAFALAEKYNKTVYAVVSNMSIAMERRDLLKKTGCIVCNEQEALRFRAFLQEGKVSPVICLSHLRIIKEPQESLRTYLLHGAEIDIIAYAGKQNRRSQRIRRRLNFPAHFLLHREHEIIEGLFDRTVSADLSLVSKPAYKSPVKQIYHVGGSILGIAVLQKLPDLSQIIFVLNQSPLFIIQADSTLF